MICSTCPHAQACCRRYKVPLTVEEDQSGWFQTSPDRAFIVHLARRHDGACVYLDESGRCSIHAYRPETCREYSCAGDTRLEGAR